MTGESPDWFLMGDKHSLALQWDIKIFGSCGQFYWSALLFIKICFCLTTCVQKCEFLGKSMNFQLISLDDYCHLAVLILIK